MVNVGNFTLLILLTQFILQVLFIGILLVELFNHKRKNKSSVVWFLMVILFWVGFVVISEVMLFGSGFSFILSILSIISLVIALAIYIIIIVKWFSILNKIITFPVGIVATAILIRVLIDRYYFDPITILLMSLSIFFVSVMGTFVFLDVFIKESSGYKAKAVKKHRRMNWKSIITGLLIGIIVVGLFIVGFFYGGGYVAPELSGELNVYNWKEYFDENDAVLDDFEKETGVKINFYTYETEEEGLDAVENYRGVYDIVVAIDMSFEAEIIDDKLEKLELRNIPNIKNIDPKFEIIHNKNFEYGVPYIWGTTGLVINTKYIPEDVNSWDILWDPKYKGKVGILFNEIELFGIGARYVGAPLVQSKISDVNKIGDFLKLQKKLIGGYMSPYDIIDGMINESIWIAATWNVDAAIMSYDNPNIKYIIPKEGTVMWIEHMVVPKGAPNKENAEAFINFIHRPDIYARIANWQGSPGVNILAREFIDEEIMNNEAINIPQEDYDKLEDYYVFESSPEIEDARHEIWEELIK
jgi:spermidine/putrescine transport system substrate-binding protein